VHFDANTRLFEISVRELIEEDDVFRRVGFERSQAWRRLSLGGEAHRRLLAARQKAYPGYQGEVFLTGEFETEEFRAVVTGRLDGAVETQNGSWLIEEFKTCSFSPEGKPQYSLERGERARRQLEAYCLLWERAGRGRARAALVWIDGASAREESQQVGFHREEAERELTKRLLQKFERLRALQAAVEAKAAAAAHLVFPHRKPRPIQEELMEAISTSIDSDGHLLAQAPTGSGKTAAALFAGLRGALQRGKRLLFLTPKNLQQELVVRTLAAINDGSFRALHMRSKEGMCANDRILCHEDHCRFAKDYPLKMERSGLLPRLIESPMLLPERVFAEARDLAVCPFEVELELASRADAFVGDYNYVFEPVTALSAFAPEFLGEAILIVDEAHNLPDRARKIHSPELAESQLRQVENLASLSPGAVWTKLAGAVARFREFVGRCGEAVPEGDETEDAAAEVEISEEDFADCLAAWDPAIVSYFEWKRETGDVSEDDPVMTLHFSVVRFGRVLRFAKSHDDFARVARRTSAGLVVSLVCLDPARALSPIVNGAASTILLSATLEPFEALIRLTGLDPERTSAVRLPPPFPPENRRTLIVPTVRTTFAARERNYGKIADLLSRLADAHTGNDLAIFPSFRFLDEVARRLPPMRARILRQKENLTDFEKRAILETLDAPPPDGLLFLAVSGGMYSEGLDYPGERLSGVFIVSPSLPQVSFERELLRRYFDEHDDSGFEYAYVLPGMTRVVQAAGRLIRSETDRGVIVLLCRRFLERPYARYLPRDWYGEEPAELVCLNPEESVRDFFSG
jgi:DNA excision repair protein ERCC-2